MQSTSQRHQRCCGSKFIFEGSHRSQGHLTKDCEKEPYASFCILPSMLLPDPDGIGMNRSEFYRRASKRTIYLLPNGPERPRFQCLLCIMSMCALAHMSVQFKHLRPAIQSLVSRLWCHEVDGPRDRLLNHQSYVEDCDTVRSHHVLTLKMDIKRCTQQTCPTSSNQSSSAKQKTE